MLPWLLPRHLASTATLEVGGGGSTTLLVLAATPTATTRSTTSNDGKSGGGTVVPFHPVRAVFAMRTVEFDVTAEASSCRLRQSRAQLKTGPPPDVNIRPAL
jgi:hypothetical protein